MPWFSIVHSFLKSNAEIADTDSTIPYLKLLQQRLAEESSECVDKNPTIIAEKSEENSAKMSQSIEAIKIPVKKKKASPETTCLYWSSNGEIGTNSD